MEEVVYENQQYFIGPGWSPNVTQTHKVPRWSSFDGTIDLNPNHLMLPDDKWEWSGEWYVNRPPDSNEGVRFTRAPRVGLRKDAFVVCFPYEGMVSIGIGEP